MSSTPVLSSSLDPAELIAVVNAFARSADGWQAHVRYDPDDRVSMLLYADDLVDVYLSTWLPGQRSSLHDHGDSATGFCVVAGRLEDLRLARSGRTSRRRLRPGRCTWSPTGVIHDVGNASRQPAVSVHAYSPPLREVSFYRRQRLTAPTCLRTVRLMPSVSWEAAGA